MSDRTADENFLQQALDLARRGVGLASPNPCVGAVIVDADENVAGVGFHTYEGVKHAEALALAQAGQRARGATLYVNLEPCSHQGRTPPCADALIAAGIRRVVASIVDPNPAVAGKGFEKLRSAGIKVKTGALSEEARRLNESFARYILHRIPFVTLKSAMTLDGKIAHARSVDKPGDRTTGVPRGGWITGELARKHVQQLRHENDALLVGVGTILADDPLLTDRSGIARRRRLLRVILDSHLRVSLNSRLVRNVKDDDVLIFCLDSAHEKQGLLRERGVRVEVVPNVSNGYLNLHAVLLRLSEMQITSVMIEGGATINGAALAAGIVDKVFFYYAPKIFGGGVPFAPNTNFGIEGNPLTIKSVRVHRFGDDHAVEGYIRDPYED